MRTLKIKRITSDDIVRRKLNLVQFKNIQVLLPLNAKYKRLRTAWQLLPRIELGVDFLQHVSVQYCSDNNGVQRIFLDHANRNLLSQRLCFGLPHFNEHLDPEDIDSDSEESYDYSAEANAIYEQYENFPFYTGCVKLQNDDINPYDHCKTYGIPLTLPHHIPFTGYKRLPKLESFPKSYEQLYTALAPFNEIEYSATFKLEHDFRIDHHKLKNVPGTKVFYRTYYASQQLLHVSSDNELSTVPFNKIDHDDYQYVYKQQIYQRHFDGNTDSQELLDNFIPSDNEGDGGDNDSVAEMTIKRIALDSDENNDEYMPTEKQQHKSHNQMILCSPLCACEKSVDVRTRVDMDIETCKVLQVTGKLRAWLVKNKSQISERAEETVQYKLSANIELPLPVTELVDPKKAFGDQSCKLICYWFVRCKYFNDYYILRCAFRTHANRNDGWSLNVECEDPISGNVFYQIATSIYYYYTLMVLATSIEVMPTISTDSAAFKQMVELLHTRDVTVLTKIILDIWYSLTLVHQKFTPPKPHHGPTCSGVIKPGDEFQDQYIDDICTYVLSDDTIVKPTYASVPVAISAEVAEFISFLAYNTLAGGLKDEFMLEKPKYIKVCAQKREKPLSLPSISSDTSSNASQMGSIDSSQLKSVSSNTSQNDSNNSPNDSENEIQVVETATATETSSNHSCSNEIQALLNNTVNQSPKLLDKAHCIKTEPISDNDDDTTAAVAVAENNDSSAAEHNNATANDDDNDSIIATSCHDSDEIIELSDSEDLGTLTDIPPVIIDDTNAPQPAAVVVVDDAAKHDQVPMHMLVDLDEFYNADHYILLH